MKEWREVLLEIHRMLAPHCFNKGFKYPCECLNGFISQKGVAKQAGLTVARYTNKWSKSETS
uniref:Uncharacterized protein n=1 Tax=Arundo donax TaxID=35708 RepID=A0A0A9G3J2_ARUDO